ncbi:MAG: DUF6036 family nucleotidyltransferase [Acidimicrobiales bacterium]
MCAKPYYDHPERWAERLKDLFARHGAQVVVIGGLAALHYRAEPRHTVDADFVIDRLRDLDEALRVEGFTVNVFTEDDGSPYLMNGTSPDGMHLDVYVAQTEFEHEVLARRTVDGYASVEDLIVYKLIAWRPQDRDDIAQIIVNCPVLDTERVALWAARWEVTERWSEAAAWTLHPSREPTPALSKEHPPAPEINRDPSWYPEPPGPRRGMRL